MGEFGNNKNFVLGLKICMKKRNSAGLRVMVETLTKGVASSRFIVTMYGLKSDLRMIQSHKILLKYWNQLVTGINFPR